MIDQDELMAHDDEAALNGSTKPHVNEVAPSARPTACGSIPTAGYKPTAANRRGPNGQMLAATPYVTDAQGAPEIKRLFTGVVGTCHIVADSSTGGRDQRKASPGLVHPRVTFPWGQRG